VPDRERQANAAGDQIADRQHTAVVGLEPVDRREPLLSRVVARDRDAEIAERLLVLRQPLPEGGEDDHLLPGREHVLDALLHRLVFGLVQRDAHLRELGQERGVIRTARIGVEEPHREGSLRLQDRQAVDSNRHPFWVAGRAPPP